MNFVKIILRTYKGYGLAAFLAFVNTIMEKMYNIAAYVDVKPEVDTAHDTWELYTSAAGAAEGGSTTAKSERDEIRVQFEKDLDALADKMEAKTDKPLSWFLGSGFHLRRSREYYEGDIEKAVIIILKRGKLSGSVLGKVNPFPKAVHQIVVHYSTDGGETWVFGAYSTGQNFKLLNLPIEQNVLVQAAFIGTRQRMGDWSDPKPIFVL